MKKIIITALAAAMVLCFCSCSKADTADIHSIASASSSTGDESKPESVSSENSQESSAINSSENNMSAQESSSESETVSKKTTDSKPESTLSSTSSEDEVIPVEIESEPTGYESEISGEWKARRILDPSGNEISGEELYGTAYRTYGGAIEFNEDGTFDLRMGVSSEDTTSTGTFLYEGGDEITLHFYNDSSSVCKIEETDGKKTILMPFDIFGDTFTVYFEIE